MAPVRLQLPNPSTQLTSSPARGFKSFLPGTHIAQSPAVDLDLTTSPSPTQISRCIRPHLVAPRDTSIQGSENLIHSSDIGLTMPTEPLIRSLRQPHQALLPHITSRSKVKIPIAPKTNSFIHLDPLVSKSARPTQAGLASTLSRSPPLTQNNISFSKASPKATAKIPIRWPPWGPHDSITHLRLTLLEWDHYPLS